MAAAVITVTVVNNWSDGKRQHVIGTLDFDTGDYAAGGIALTFNDPKIKSTKLRWLDIKGLSAQYRYVYVASTGKVQVFDEHQTSGVQAELAAAAVPAGVDTDVIDFYGIFDQLR